MNLDEFESLGLRPFGIEDAEQMEARHLGSSRLGLALWGRTSADLQRQLLAAHPDIPTGFDLADFRALLQSTEAISAWLISVSLRDPRYTWLPLYLSTSPTIWVGTQQFTVWEARCEVVRRAIEYLENR